MKAVCPITGIPFRTYDLLPLQVICEHPIFQIAYDHLILALEDIRKVEEEQIKTIDEKMIEQKDEVHKAISIETLAMEAIYERNYRNPIFKLYQTKTLVLLALMKHASLLENEKGFAARPSPRVVEAYFWNGVELFVWANSIRNPQIQNKLPRYRISKQNEDMSNFSNYLDALAEIKTGIGTKYRSLHEEHQLANLEFALALLAKRRNSLKLQLTSGSNTLAAKWALVTTRCPKDIYPFWFAIIASPSINICFDGVKVGEEMQSVAIQDLRELRDYLEDNLLGPRGEPQKDHYDDSEYYFIARQTVLNIIRKHIAVFEQGTTPYQIVNQTVGGNILNASDDQLEKKALEQNLSPKPNYSDFKSRVDFIKAVATWRHDTKNLLIELTPAKEKQVSTTRRGTTYEIL